MTVCTNPCLGLSEGPIKRRKDFMRCQKCGYFSFDHLSECKNCGVDLAMVRDGMGLLPIEPSIPFFLGALLKGGENAAPQAEINVLSASPPESSGIQFAEEFELDTLDIPAGNIDGPSPSVPIQIETKEHVDSPVMVFDDDAGGLSGALLSPSVDDKGGTGEEEAEFEIDFVLDEAELSVEFPDSTPKSEDLRMKAIEGGRESKEGGAMEAAARTLADSPALELSDADLNRLMEDPELEKDLEFELDFDSDVHEPVQQTGSVLEKPKSSDWMDEGLVMELSEDDLESLMIELEDVAGEDPGVPPDAKKNEGSRRLKLEKS